MSDTQEDLKKQEDIKIAKKNQRLIQGSITKHILTLAWPTFLGLFCTYSFAMVGMFYISLLGNTYLTAYSFVFPLMNVIVGIGIGISSASNASVSRTIGIKSNASISSYMGANIYMCLILGGIVAFVGIISIDPLFTQLGAPQQSINLLRAFMWSWYGQLGLLFLVFSLSSSLRALGRAKQAAFVQLFMAFTNAGLDPIFIFIAHWGLLGLGISAIVSRALGVLIMLFFLFKQKLIQKASFSMPLRLLFKHWAAMLNVAIPSALTNMIIPLSAIWSIYLLSSDGPLTVAGYGVATRIAAFMILPLNAFGSAMAPIVGQNFSTKKFHRSWQAFQITSLFCILWTVIVSLFLNFFGVSVMRIFTDNVHAILVGALFFHIVTWSFIGSGVRMMVGTFFSTIGYPKRATLISFIRIFILFIPLSLLLQYFWGVPGIFAASLISNFSVGILAYIWVKILYDKKMKNAL